MKCNQLKTAFAVTAILLSPLLYGQSTKTLCVIGSSTAYGIFPFPSPAYPRDSGWVAKVNKYYKNLNLLDTTFNLAELSTDCYSGMPTGYIPPAGENMPDVNTNITKAISMVPKPDVIIINYPTNNYDRLSNAEIIQCLQTMKDSANANNIRCYIATTQPRSSFDSAGRKKLKNLKDLMISTFGIWAINFFTPVAEEPSLMIRPEYSVGDGIHLNPSGHTVLAQQVINQAIFATVLPVRFNYFNGNTINKNIVLNWGTSDEINTLEFKVQRSVDGVIFDNIATISASGSADINQRYIYQDATPNIRGFYYRLAAIDNNQSRQFSPNIFIPSINKSFVVGNIFPTPSKNMIYTQIVVKGKNPFNIFLRDAYGRLLNKQQMIINDDLLYKADISKLSSGMYFLHISDGKTTEVLQVIKSN